MDPMLESFLQESRDNLEAVGQCFLQLEENARDNELLNDLFRSIHTIKGSSGLFDIAPLTRVVHAAEDVLDQVREGAFELEADHIDLFLEAMDQIEAWLDDLETTEQLGDNAESLGQVLSQKLRALLGEDSAAATQEAPAAAEVENTQGGADTAASLVAPPAAEVPDWLAEFSHDDRIRCYEQAEQSAPVYALSYTPDEQCFFNGEDPLFLVQTTPGLMCYQVMPREPWGELESIDPFHCNLRIRLLSTADENSLREHFRYVAEQITLIPLQVEQLAFPSGEMGDVQQYTDLIANARQALAQQDYQQLKNCIRPALEIGAAELLQTRVLDWMMHLIEHIDNPDAERLSALLQALETGHFEPGVASSETAVDTAMPAPSAADVDHDEASETFSDAMRVLLETQQKILALNCAPNLFKGRILSTQNILDRLLRRLSWPHQAALRAACDAALSDGTAEPLTQFVDSLLQPPTAETAPEANTAASEASTTVHDKASPSAQILLKTQLEIISMPCADSLLKGKIASTTQTLQHCLAQLGWQEALVALEQASEQAMAQTSSAPLVQFLQQLLDDAGIEDKAQAAQAEKKATSPAAAKEQAAGDRKKAAKPAEQPAQKAVNKTLRVDQERIDALMDLVGELIVAKNALPFLARRAEEDFNVKALAKEIKAQYAVINRLADELQNAMMSVRMVPVSSIFQRFPRLVRDLSRRLDKKIQLVMEGEDTEADKNVIESLADPLIHLVRNSLDHGIEMPEERVAVGKPEQGTLILRAIPMDDQVVIEIIDDGKGIDPNVIKQKAYEKGVITEEKLDTISDQEAIELIFAAGLSSKEEASDISGRGVGMDVVRNAVNQAGGSVSVRSEVGKGTTLRLSLPLSMAVAQVMMVEVDQQVYGISMEHIRETVRVPSDRIQRIKHTEAIILRDKLIPLCRLRQLLKLEPHPEPLEEEAILIIAVNGEEVGLVIDAFHEGIDVIQKPLEGVMSHYPTYAGATLLGDGRVLLILDIQELIACQ